ncbi:MAG: DUF5671 domain-containing protein [Candidatus Gracilibacteria bacterium]|nr:DUF5671 domain-containing protein [bacterium]MDZ4217080.1 DUF5671 domain-containing protein [Candidatus Gracilibacteria bacterium]
MPTKSHAARHTFYYMLVLVTLSFTAIGIGQIFFQIINSVFPEIVYFYDGSFSADVLRFGISSVIIAGPAYWVVSYMINKELANKTLEPESRVRKWLTYLILFIASVTVIGFLMGLLNSFLSGELTIKFILKALTSIVIAGLVFAYYFYDIRRDEFRVGSTIVAFRVLFFLILIGSLVSGFFFIEAPSTVRAMREDDARVNNLSNLSYQIDVYYQQNRTVPQQLDQLDLTGQWMDPLYKVDPVSGDPFPYRVISESRYEICAQFVLSNRVGKSNSDRSQYVNFEWVHDAGQECFEKVVRTINDPALPIPVPMK